MDGLTFNAETHQYFLGGAELPSVTRILSDMGFIDTQFFTEYARDRGSMAHLATEYDDRNELDESTLDDELVPRVAAWRAFKRDTGFHVEEIEKTVSSDLYHFAGTLDRIGIINGQRAIVDIKNGAVAKWVGLQLSGYEIAENKRYKRYAVQLCDGGKYKLHQFSDPQDRQIFLSALACWHWIRNAKKG